MDELIETKSIDSKVMTSLDYAKQLQITNDLLCEIAIDYEKGLSNLIKEIDTTFDPHIKKAFETHRGLVAEKKRHVEPVEEAKKEEASAILDEPVNVPTVTIAKTTPSAGIGGAIREIWSAEVYDLHALVAAIVEGKASTGLIEPNQTALNGMARSLKKNMIIPGVR